MKKCPIHQAVVRSNEFYISEYRNFRWTLDLFKKGYKKVFDVDDLLNPLKTDRSTYLGDRLET